MRRIRAIVQLVCSLGLSNVLAVQIYKALLFLGLHASQRINYVKSEGELFNRSDVQLDPNSGLLAPKRWARTHEYFGWYVVQSDSIPDWHFDPFSNQRCESAFKPWWTIDEFAPGTGDIKCLWEKSRFTWIIPFAQRARLGDLSQVEQINRWYADWLEQNPPGLGPNWMCGQEASIRVVHATSASIILGCLDRPSPEFLSFLLNHSRRILPTRRYAIAQRNNHAVSEGVALFIAGTLLERNGVPRGKPIGKQGRKLLERAMAELVHSDGAFSQVSTNYQRMVVDLISFAEVFRRNLGLAPFSHSLYTTTHDLLGWLRQVYIPESDSVPNLGGNDGAKVNQVLDADYRSFSDSINIGEAIFGCSGEQFSARAGEFFQWLRVDQSSNEDVQHNCDHYSALITIQKVARTDAVVFLRQPVYHPFRPANCDPLHVDFWRAGENILRDAGSYSYREDLHTLAKFHGTKGHNTVCFDDEETMPQLGRFLYANWLRPDKSQLGFSDSSALAGAYVDSRGNHHRRRVSLGFSKLEIEDEFAGPFRKAVVRWRLIPSNWSHSDLTVTSQQYTLEVQESEMLSKVTLTHSPESRYYMAFENVPVLELELKGPTALKTTLRWMS